MKNDSSRKEVPQTGCLFYIVSFLVVVAGVIWLEPIVQGWFPSYEGDIFAILFTIGFLGIIPVETYFRERREFRHWLRYEYPRLTEKAEMGNPQDQYNLGWSIFLRGCEKQCVPVSFWMLKSAEQGHVDAQTFLASQNKWGRDGIVDWEKAVYWYRKAAEQGSGLAQLNLADCYAEGLGVSKDIVQAIELYLRVAERPGEARHWGDRWYSETQWTDDHYAVDAWRKLGALYLSGVGVTKDEAEAYAYYSLVGLNSEADRKAIAELEAKLKPAELEAGKRRAKELREKLNAKRQQAGQGK